MRIRIVVIFLFLIGASSLTKAQLKVSILDEKNEPLSFVEIYTSDFTFSDYSDQEGVVLIPEAIPHNQKLIFNFLGYKQIIRSISDLRANSIVIMKPGLVLDEILMVGRTDNQARDMPGKVESINTKIFQLTNPQTAADALSQHADVFIQKSQMGGGSPVVRGFEANKVLLVLDGVRMNNAIFRSGHLQNAITVDNAMLERLEVLYGPGSIKYGSDAIGGVVHFRSKNPKLNFDSNKKINFHGNAYTRYSSANNEASAHIDFNLGGEKFGSLTSISRSVYKDLNTGSRRNENYPDFGKRLTYAARENGEDVIKTNEDPNLQIGTGYSQWDALQKFIWRPNESLRLIANLQYSTSSDVPRYDALTEPEGTGLANAEWYYGPQNRLFSSLRMDLDRKNMLFDKFILIGGFQKIDEDRIDRKFGSVNLDRQEEDVNIFSITSDFTKFLDHEESIEINYGAEYNYNHLTSTSFRTDINTGIITDNILTRYPSGGSSTNNLAAYVTAKKTFSKVNLFGGLRYNNNALSVKYLTTDGLPWPSSYYAGVTSTNDAFSWSLGATSTPISGWKIQGQVSSAFRSPNIDDLAKIRVKVDEISVPNLNLKPETSLNAELTLEKRIGDHTKISATGFITELNNAIIRDRFSLPDGKDFLIDEGDSLFTVSNINANSALVRGISTNIKAVIFPFLELSGSLSYIRGYSFDKDEIRSPLSHIPPVYGKINTTFITNKQSLNLSLRFNGEKPLNQYGGSEDNLENATPEGTPGWYTINLYYQRQLNSKISFSAGLENLLDHHYRPFASGVSAPGRNFILGLNASF